LHPQQLQELSKSGRNTLALYGYMGTWQSDLLNNVEFARRAHRLGQNGKSDNDPNHADER
jgi:hypothetical protein